MKAAVRTRYGPPGVVRITQVGKPAPGDRELLVKVHATTVNRTDCHYRSGKPWIMRPLVSGLARPRAAVLGNEFAGQVAAAGNGVTSFRVGDRVFGYTEGPFGAHAEYLVIAENGRVAVMPPNLDYEQAAPGTDGRTTVTAVCATPHLELARALGADRVLDYTTEDFTSDGPDYDVVFDAAGKSSFGQCKRLLKPRGIYMSTGPGPWYQNLILPLATPLLGGKKVVFAYPRLDQATVRHFARLMETGQFTPLIDRRYPLEQIVDAYRYAETGQKIGNLVITVAP